MNKQELIKKLKELLTTPSELEGYDFDYGHDFGIRRAISLVKQLDEQQAPINKPEKPVVPQFVADWYDDNQDDFEFNLYRLCIDYDNCELDKEMMIWFRDKNNNPIQTLTAMHQLGYIVKKEEIKKDH